ncbi:hypothetical protein EBZ80_21540 [bacterium]|nr:hypothetical protein [Betaproteobacteria bacterium]NDE17508.1 hypothetical protein [bacterium]
MYEAVLKPINSQPGPHHLRGWLHCPKRNSDVLEINNTASVDGKILAFAALMPEIEEFLIRLSPDSPLALMLLEKWRDVRYELEESANPRVSAKEAG